MTYAMLQDCRTQGAGVEGGGGEARAPSVNPTSDKGQIMLTTLREPPGFSDLPTALSASGVQNGNWSNSISPGQLNMSK